MPLDAGQIDAATRHYIIESFYGDNLRGKSTQFQRYLDNPFANNYTDAYGNVINANRKVILYAPNLNDWARKELGRMYGPRVKVVDTLESLLSITQSRSF